MTCETETPSRPHEDVIHPSAIPFILIHLGCLAAIWSGVTWQAVALGVALYWLRMFGVTAGYHRYFSHRAYAAGRVVQFLLAVLAQSSGQKSVLWWAEKHRHHHLHSDTPEDLHSPAQQGLFHSHLGWVCARRHTSADLTKVQDLASYPELRWLHRYEALPPAALAGLCFLIAGWPGLVIGFCWSTVLVYHATFCINSLAHTWGPRRYVTGDDSRNNLLLALLTMGEGWHNNHHAYQSSARQGFLWWQVDATYYGLKALAAVGLVRDLKVPPLPVVRNEQRLGARVIRRTAEQLAARFMPEQVAHKVRSATPAELEPLTAAFVHARAQMTEIVGDLSLPHIPSRSEFAAEARLLFAKTKSLDEIVDRARVLFLVAVEEHLLGAA
jgi:stearoyl-CoA desaturase (delta-9 desaturase)